MSHTDQHDLESLFFLGFSRHLRSPRMGKGVLYSDIERQEGEAE